MLPESPASGAAPDRSVRLRRSDSDAVVPFTAWVYNLGLLNVLTCFNTLVLSGLSSLHIPPQSTNTYPHQPTEMTPPVSVASPRQHIKPTNTKKPRLTPKQCREVTDHWVSC